MSLPTPATSKPEDDRLRMTPAQARVILERTAGTLAASHGISVKFVEGACPQTDGRTITIPPPNVTEWEEWLQVRGYIDHETSHILFTDLKEFEPLNDFQRLCLNALEDARVNECMRLRYGGSRENLSGMYRRTIKNAIVKKTEMDSAIAAAVAKGANPANLQQIPAHMSKLGAFQIQIEGLASLGAPEDLFGDVDGAVALAKQHAPRFRADVDKATKTVDLVQPAKDLAELIDPERAALPPPPPQPQPGQGDDGEGDSEGEGKNANGNPQAGDGKNQGKSDQPGCSPLDQASREALGEIGGGAGTYGKSRGSSRQSEAANKKACGRQHVDRIPVFKTWMDYAKDPDRGSSRYSGHDSARQAAELTLAMRMGAGIRDNLRQALRARTMARKMRDQETGGLDVNKLAVIAARVRDPAVFCKVSPGIAVNTACHVLIDASASMANPTCWPSCPAAAAIFADAAIGCGAVARVTTFDAPHVGHEWCGFGEKPTRAEWVNRLKLAAAIGGTPTGNHVQAAARDLLKRPEARKILLVVTDGDPDDHQYTMNMMRAARTAGVEVYSIGLGMDANRAAHIFGRGAVGVPQPGDLRGVLLKLLTRCMIREEGKGNK